MEEGEFVKWKQIVVGLISIMMIFTSVRGEVNENQRSNYQMLEQIEKSYVVDSGFRESNYFFLDMVDSYATYYLQCIKQLIGEEDSVERTDVSYEINCLSNKAVDQWNLLDVYSLIMLVDDVKQIPETLESSIIMYLDSLFDENNGCYQYSREFSVQDSIAPTYYVVVALKKLNQPVRPIKEWIIEISTKALEKDANMQTYYGGYAMLYELMSEYEIPISATDFEQVLEYYHGIVNYSPPSRCTRLEEGASIRRSLVSRLRGVKFTGRFLTVQTLQTILCSELTPASQPVLCKVILYSQYILSECCV